MASLTAASFMLVASVRASKAWQAAVEKQGYKYAVVRTFEEFRDLVTGYLSPSRTMKAPELF